MMTNWPFL